jgi:predicted nucleotidyltransferase
MEYNTMSGKKEEISLRLQFPLPDDKVFRYQSVEEILEVLVNNPHQEFSVSQLGEITSQGGGSLSGGIEVLKSLDLIEIRESGKKSMISINRERVEKPDDPVFSIPQDSFREPVMEFKQKALSRIDYVAGIIVFGSVARGEADRASDIDILIVVEDSLTPARRKASELASELQEIEIEGQRYEFEVLVESTESAGKRGDKMRNIFSEGIVLHNSKTLEKLKEEVFQ